MPIRWREPSTSAASRRCEHAESHTEVSRMPVIRPNSRDTRVIEGPLDDGTAFVDSYPHLVDVRLATPDELEAICEFGAAYIPEHYEPLLGSDAAQAQVDDWWAHGRMSRAVDEGRVVVAIEAGDVVGVGEWSLYDGNPVIWKLYVHPSHRSEGIGPRLIATIIDHLPNGVDRIQVEHFAVNQRAGTFYEREGFRELHKVEQSNPAMTVIWRERSLD